MRFGRGILLGLFTLSLAACATLGGVGNTVPLERRSVDVVLENRSWEQGIFRVYDRGSQLGAFRVPGMTSDTVTVRPFSTQLQVQVRPFAGNEVWRFDPVAVRGGDVVQVTMQNHLPMSSIALIPAGQAYWLARYDHQPGAYFSGLERVDPPAQWREWRGEIEECADLEEGAGDITWFVADKLLVASFGGPRLLRGLYYEEMIYLHRPQADSARVVKHELAHNILQRNGVPDSINAAHAHPVFRECGLLSDEGK